MSYDDMPVGGGGGGGMKLSSPAVPQEDNFGKLSLQQLFTHSNWKARKEGLDKVTKDPKKSKGLFFENIAKISTESNAAAQESLFDALVALVRICNDEELATLCGAPLSLAVEKGITGRPKAAQSSQTLASLLVEYGKHVEVFDVLLTAFAHKTPKNRMAAAQLCTLLIGEYGVAHFPLKDILKKMQVLFNDANPQVRKEAISLCCQCYKYIGSSIKGFLTDLRDVQLQELEKQFVQVKLGEKPPKSIKGLKDTSAPRASTGKAMVPVGSLTDGGQNGDISDEAFELLDESPVVGKLPRNFFRKALDKEVQWQERCALVTDTLLPLLAAPRFRAKDDYHEFGGFIRQYLLDPQAPPMLLGFKMIQECARGLRAGFATQARSYLTPLFDKMKDKKTSVLEHVMLTLEKLIQYHCVTLDLCHDDMEQVSQSKNPSQRLALMNFLIRMMEKLDSSEFVRLSKSTAMLKRMVNDEKASNKDVAYVLLNKLIAAFGEAPFKPVVASLDEKQRIRFELAVAKSTLATPANNNLTPSSSPAKKLQRVEVAGLDGADARRQRASSRGVLPRPSEAMSSAAPSTSADGAAPRRSRTSSVRGSLVGATRSKRAAASGEDPISLEATLPPKMESVNAMLGLMNGDTSIYDLVRSKDWSERLDGVTKIKTVVSEWSPVMATSNFNFVLVFLRYYPSFQESTFQVFQMILATLRALLSKTRSITPAAGYALVAECTPRLTDTKNRTPVREMCTAVAEKLSVRLVVRHMILVAAQVKTPKLLQECNEFLAVLIRGSISEEEEQQQAQQHDLDTKQVVEYIKKPCFEQNTQPVRASAVQLLVVLRQAVGSGPIDALRSTFPSALTTQYESELQRSGDGTNSGLNTLASTNRSSSITMSSARQSLPSTPNPKRIRPQLQTQDESPQAGGRKSVGPSTQAVATPVTTLHIGGQTPSATGGSPRPSAVMGGSASTFGSDVPSALRHVLRQITGGADWRERLEGVRKVEEYLQSNGNTLPPGAVGPLLRSLSSRFDEANKNFVVDVMRMIPVVVEAGGHAESAVAMRKLLPGAFAYLGDQKAALREEARRVVFLGVEVVGLDVALPCFQKPLSSDSNLCRQNTLEAMLFGFERLPADLTMPRAGVGLLVPYVVTCLMDRISEVRVAAEQVLRYFLPITGEDPVYRYVQQLKVADQQAVTPAIERQLQLCSPAVNTTANTTVVMDGVEDEEEEGLAAARGVHTPRKCSPRHPTSGPATPQVHVSSRRPSVTTPRRGSLTTPRTPRTPRTGACGSPSANGKGHHINTNSTLSATAAAVAAATAALANSNRSAAPFVVTAEPQAHTTAAAPVPASATPAPTTTQKSQQSVPQKVVTKTKPATSPHKSKQTRETSVGATSNEEMYSIQEIILGLRSVTSQVAYNMCTDFMRHFKAREGCVTHELLLAMIERLYENTHALEPELAMALINCLSTVFISSRGKDQQMCNSSFLFRLLGTIFDCLLSEQFSLNEQVLKSLNGMTLRLLEGCPANDVFSALLSRMTSYSTTYLQTGRKSDLKYIQVTVKCVMRLDLEQVSADNIILCCHEYLLQHPPSAFRGLDDLPIRTIKTILQNLTRRCGPELLGTANRLVGGQNLVTHFIRACLDSRDKATRSKEDNDQQALEESRHTQRASQSPTPNKAATRKKSPGPGSLQRVTPTPVATHVDPTVPHSVSTPRATKPHRSVSPSAVGATANVASSSSHNTSAATALSNGVEGPYSSKVAAAIFSKIRNHVTSAEGINDLYMYLKDAPSGYEEEFDLQFRRCSEAFRLYIKRKLERKLAEDNTKPQGFHLPAQLNTV